MKSIPSGEVAFLFTDVEGSTRLAQKYPGEFQKALQVHNKILSDAIESNNGFIFKIIGDAFCASFMKANDALQAAYTVQVNLSRHKWNPAEIKVRMGIHSGKSEWVSEDYTDYVTLARVNRIMSAANGGQIILSSGIYSKYYEEGGSRFSFRDLGKRKLKDLIKPEHIYQLTAEGLQTEFPPLKTLDVRPNNLPVQLTSFVGREKEINEIKKLFSEYRLISLLGTGGSGKTRLSLQIGADLIDEFSHGVWLAELAQINDSSKIIQAINSVFKLSASVNSDEKETLINYLKNKELLLILDNCEHLLEGCSIIAETLLKKCPGLKILVSSRESLKVYGEKTYIIPSLSSPEKGKSYGEDELIQFESVRLFIERAAMVNINFSLTGENASALSQLCYNLEGIPLAIELAAARVRIMTVENILIRLKDRFRILTGGSKTSLPKQQTLKALIDWSYDLLTDDEKILFGRLSVFNGGWTYDAAVEICSDSNMDSYAILDLLQSLADKSLLAIQEKNSEKRFTMLESIREYAKGKNESGKVSEEKHYKFYSRIAVLDDISGENPAQIDWLNKLNADVDNIRSAIEYGIKNNRTDIAGLIKGFMDYSSIKGSFYEAHEICDKLLNMNILTGKKERADLLLLSAEMLNGKGNLNEAAEKGSEAMNIYRELNEKSGIANSLNLLGKIYLMKQDSDNSIKCHEEALKIGRELNSKTITAKSLFDLSIPISAKKILDLYKLGFEYREEALRLYKEIGDLNSAGNVLASMGIFAFYEKEYEDSLKYTQESYELIKLFDNHYLASQCHVVMACAYMGLKEFDSSLKHLFEAKYISEEYIFTLNFLPVNYYLGEVFRNKNNYAEAISYYKASLNAGLTAGSNYYAVKNFLGIAITLYELKSFADSLKLILIIDSLIKENKIHLENDKIDKKDELKNLMSKSLQEKEFDTIRKSCENISFDEAIEFSLSIDDSVISEIQLSGKQLYAQKPLK